MSSKEGKKAAKCVGDVRLAKDVAVAAAEGGAKAAARGVAKGAVGAVAGVAGEKAGAAIGKAIAGEHGEFWGGKAGGLGAAVGVGAAVGGPVGAGVATAGWVAGESIGLVFDEIKRNQPPGNCDGQMEDFYDRLLEHHATPFLAIVYGGHQGGVNWGYATNAGNITKHEWFDRRCYCHMELNPRSAKPNCDQDTFRERCEAAVREAIQRFPDGSSNCCIERAKFICNKVGGQCGTACYSICKMSPGGFDQWCYKPYKIRSSHSGFRFHEWRTTSEGGLFGIGKNDACFAVQLY